MQNLTQSISSHMKEYRQSMEKNISETKMNLDQIRQYQKKNKHEHNNILPFSLQQHFKSGLKESHASENQCSKIFQSNLSQKLNWLSSRNTSFHAPQSIRNQESPAHQRSIKKQKATQHKQHKPIAYVADSFASSKNQENIQDVSNHLTNMDSSGLQKVQVQVHLTIAKKKFTLKLSSLINSQDLSDIIETFLTENQISNPAKKNHLKTKNSIIRMVQQKLQQSKLHSQEKPIGQSLSNNWKTESLKRSPIKQQNIKEKNDSRPEFQQSKKSPINQSRIHKRNKGFEQIIKKENSNISQAYYSQQEDGCSPSFKGSEYVSKSPITKTSSFSPEPKHKQNRYEKLIADYYNDNIIQKPNSNSSKQQLTKHSVEQRLKPKQDCLVKQPSLDSMQNDQFDQRKKENHNHQIQINSNQQTSTPKSVYEKWKQKEKSKDQLKPSSESFSNALRERKISQNNQLNKNINIQINKQNQHNWNKKHDNHLKQNKWIDKLNHSQILAQQEKSKTRSIKLDKSQTKIRQKQSKNHLRETSSTKIDNHQFLNSKNPNVSHQNKTPNKNFNKTQANDKSVAPNYSPYNAHLNRFQSQVSPLKSNKSVQKSKIFENPNTSKVYTVHDQQFPTGEHSAFEMSPDHFYKQGLIFEAKKQHQLSQKFKNIYPFTTRVQQIDKNSRKTGQIPVNRSRDKYFSSQISSKSSNNIVLGQRQKSALHERLYKQDNQRKMKQVELEANKKIFKIAKTPTSKIQINLMHQNLKQIKGLSQEKKIKLIEKNMEIKEKIREKDKMIDEELGKMIKEGKVRSACEIVTMRKSPFRKTQVF